MVKTKVISIILMTLYGLPLNIIAAEKDSTVSPCVVTENIPVNYFSPERAYGWALCVDIGDKRISKPDFPQPAKVGKYSIELSDEKKFKETPVMKFSYSGDKNKDKRFTIFRKDGHHLYPKNDGVRKELLDGLGVWVYGNASGDILEYCDTWGNQYDPKKVTFRKKIDWEGWKFIELPCNRRYKRFWGITVVAPKGLDKPRPPIYFAQLTPRQRKDFQSVKESPLDPLTSRVAGLDFSISISVPTGDYELEVGISPPFNKHLNNNIGFQITSDKGKELFSYKPGKKDGPWWKFPVKSIDNKLKIYVSGQKQCKAWINAIRLFKNGKCIANYDLGLNPKDEGYFTNRTNLVPNPGFEVIDKTGIPIGWKISSKNGKKNNVITAEKGNSHSGQRAICITPGPDTVTMETITRQFWQVGGNINYGASIDYTRTYTFNAWVRCENAVGNVKFELVWNRITGGIRQRKDKAGRTYKSWSCAVNVDQLGVAESKNIVSKTDGWKQISITVKPPYGADHVVFRLKSNLEKGTVWIDDMGFDGFGNAQIETVVSQGGYHPSATKRAIISLRKKADAPGSFFLTTKGTHQIVSSDSRRSGKTNVVQKAHSNKQNRESGNQVYKGNLTRWGTDEWGREIWIADFSGFTKEGSYELTVLFPNGVRSKTHPFSIDKQHYNKLIDKVRHYLYVARCGMAIPGWHDACHLDDARSRDGKEHYDMTGGWHDAGSVDKQMGCASIIIVNLATMALEALNQYPPVTVEKLQLPDLLDEALWGAEQLLKMQLPDGRIYVAVNPANGGMITSQNNIPGDYDDRPLIGPYGSPPSINLLAWSRTARVLKKQKNPRWQRYMKALKLSYPIMKNDSEAVQVDLDMWRLTGDKKYLDNAGKRAKKLFAGLKQKTYYWKAPDYNRLISLIEYALAVPNSKLADEIKIEVVKFIDDVFAPFTRLTPYSHVMNWELLFPHTIDSWQENKSMISAPAYFLTQAYRLIGEKKYLEMADDQLQWIMGRNPMGGSMLAGVGNKFQMPTTAVSYSCPAHRNGLITGAVIRSCSSGNGKLTTPYSGGVPRFFPIIYTASDVPGHMLSGGEIWSPVSSRFMRVCYELDKAIKNSK